VTHRIRRQPCEATRPTNLSPFMHHIAACVDFDQTLIYKKLRTGCARAAILRTTSAVTRAATALILAFAAVPNLVWMQHCEASAPACLTTALHLVPVTVSHGGACTCCVVLLMLCDEL
jgi:hypothetical protein